MTGAPRARDAAKRSRLRHLDPVLHRHCDDVCDAAGAVMVQHLFRLERMEEMQSLLAGRGHAEARGPRADASERIGGAMRSEALPGVAAALGRIYARDAALFGYGPPLSHP